MKRFNHYFVLLSTMSSLAAPLTVPEPTMSSTAYVDRAHEIAKTMLEVLRDRKKNIAKKWQTEAKKSKQEEQAAYEEQLKRITEEHKARKKNLQSAYSARKKELAAQAKSDRHEINQETARAIQEITDAKNRIAKKNGSESAQLSALAQFLTLLKEQARELQLTDLITLISQEEARLARDGKAIIRGA